MPTAEAQTLEQQYAIANNFDPFSAIANWQQAEGDEQRERSGRDDGAVRSSGRSDASLKNLFGSIVHRAP